MKQADWDLLAEFGQVEPPYFDYAVIIFLAIVLVYWGIK